MKLAILIYGLQSDPNMNKILNQIQWQLNKIGNGVVDIVYRINDEESIEQKQAWLLSQTECKKYVFVTTDSHLEENFIILRHTCVKLRKPTAKLIELGVYSK